MADIIRSAKSGSDWTQNELVAYNITVVYQDAVTFFQSPALPAPSISPEILNTQNASDAHDDDVYALLRTLDLAMVPPPSEESAVNDFVVNLFRGLGYTRRGRVARTRKDIPLFICGEQRYAKTDVSIMDDTDILLIVQEDKRYLDDSDPEPQLIAEAIAAFSANNNTHVRTLGLPPLGRKIMPGIIMKGTSPIFYKAHVTTVLTSAIALGRYPEVATIVYAHLPSLPRPALRWTEGMKPLDNRRLLLSCYEAFRHFM